MDPNRLGLNFGGGAGGGFNNGRNYPANDGRVFPTTPSSFPQPVFPTQGGQIPTDYVNAQVQAPNGYGGQSPGGYFMNAPSYQSQYGQQPHAQYQNQYQPPNPQAPQSSYQQRPGYASDPTSGLARQFSNQNLGSNQRQPSPFARQPSPSNQRPRNAGGPRDRIAIATISYLPLPESMEDLSQIPASVLQKEIQISIHKTCKSGARPCMHRWRHSSRRT